MNMKFNKIILYSFVLLVLSFSVTAISAADLNDTSDVGDVLKDGGDSKSFIDLNNDIAAEDSSFNMGSDYTFDNLTDMNYTLGIRIVKADFTINGNNHAIDCSNQARALRVAGNNVEIKNLVIKNAYHSAGSAIFTNSKLTLNNVTFINCSGKGSSNMGAIVLSKATLNVKNCKFIDTCGSEGASITASLGRVTVDNSTFISSSDKILKGQIYLSNSNLTVLNSNFINTTSKYATAIFATEKGKVSISNSKFTNLFANKTAGAIATKSLIDLTVKECEFENVGSDKNGGAIFIDVNGDTGKHQKATILIDSAKFTNCSSEFGGAILQLGGTLTIKNSDFVKNSVEYDGGAVYTSYANVNILNSTFKSNMAKNDLSYGGAGYFDKGTVIIRQSTFENNLAFEVSTISAYDTKLTLENNYFNNPSNVTSIYTVYGKVSGKGNAFNSDKRSFGNTDNFYNFENTANPFIIYNNTIVGPLPEKFDLRDYGWVSPVKNQGFMGACWAFGNVAALESALMRYANVTYLLSENNVQNSMLQYSKYGQLDMDEGGTPFAPIAYLVDWMGIFPGEYDSYDELGKISPLLITPDDIHIQNVVVVPARKNSADNNLIKNALLKYGALAVSHNADFDEDTYFNKSSSAQYYYGKPISNHRVCVVGWDDNYSRNNFLKPAPGDGAWIVKNSWGSNWADGGYFYVSDYDKSFAMDKESVGYIINNDSYNRMYQIDVGGEIKLVNTYNYYSNVFTADENELIAAVGTYFDKTGRDYVFTISVNDVDVYSQKGASEFGGYSTIKLNKYIQIKKGDVFQITFKNKLPVLFDLRIHTKKGTSLVSKDGREWIDLANTNNVAILKAYTISDSNITGNLVKYYKNDTPFVAKVGAGEEVVFTFNGKKSKVIADENGIAKLNINSNPGKYSITTTYNGTSIVNYVIIKNTVVDSNVKRTYNANCNYKVRILDSAGKPVKSAKVAVSVNGKSKNYKTDNSGYITVKFTKLAKAQKITVKNPKTGESRTTKILVYSRFSDEKNVAMYYFDGSKFKATILGDNAKPVGKNKVVVIKINKKTYKVKTNAKGAIAFKIPNTIKPGSYKLTASYKGETIKKTVKVKQNLKSKKYSVKKSSKKLVVKATLKNGKKAVSGKKITLNLNGIKIAKKTNKKGIAQFTIKKSVINKLSVGKKYTMKFTYLKNTIKTTLTVKR